MNKAFTIIEMIVVIGIILLITGLILPNYRSNDKQLALERSIHKTAQDLRRIQEMAISAKEYNCSAFPPNQKLKGYGINFYNHQFSPEYAYFYSTLAKCTFVYDGEEQENTSTMERIYLETGIKIKEIKQGDTVVNSAYIFFYPPDPETDLSGASKVEVTLAVEDDLSQTRTVEINKIGVISIK